MALSRLGFTALLLAVSPSLLAGCGGGHGSRGDDKVTYERLGAAPDTASLSSGQPLVTDFDLKRLANGLLQASGHSRFPDGTKLRIAIKAQHGKSSLAMTEVTIEQGSFESAPMLGETGPLPVGDYKVELLAHFTSEWQTPDVLRATEQGRALRGPGITRSRVDGAAFYLVEDMKR